MSYNKIIKTFFNYLNINGTEAGGNLNPHPRPICYTRQVKPIH